MASLQSPILFVVVGFLLLLLVDKVKAWRKKPVVFKPQYAAADAAGGVGGAELPFVARVGVARGTRVGQQRSPMPQVAFFGEESEPLAALMGEYPVYTEQDLLEIREFAERQMLKGQQQAPPAAQKIEEIAIRPDHRLEAVRDRHHSYTPPPFVHPVWPGDNDVDLRVENEGLEKEEEGDNEREREEEKRERRKRSKRSRRRRRKRLKLEEEDSAIAACSRRVTTFLAVLQVVWFLL